MSENISLKIDVKGKYIDIELEHCVNHNEWFTDGCQQCTVDRMEQEKQERYDEGFEAGKAAAK